MRTTLQRSGARTLAGLCIAGLTALACAAPSPRPSATAPPAPKRSDVAPTQAAPAKPSAERVWTEFALGLHPGRGTALAAYMEADLIRRRGGEWVIVSLSSTAQAAGRVASARSGTAADPEILALLREYERAFERRDAMRLARVWLMNPSERSRMQRLFDRSDAIAVSIRDADVVVDGNRASLAFDQRFVVSGHRVGSASQARAMRRALAARDSLGTWALEDIAGTP